MAAVEFFLLVAAVFVAAVLVAIAVARAERRRAQMYATEMEGEFEEQEIRRSIIPPASAAHHALVVDIMASQVELARKTEFLRRSSYPPAPGSIPPPPPEMWEALNRPWMPAIPPPPNFILPKPPKTPKE